MCVCVCVCVCAEQLLQGCVRKHHPTTLGCHSIFIVRWMQTKIEWHPSVVGWCFRTQPRWYQTKRCKKPSGFLMKKILISRNIFKNSSYFEFMKISEKISKAFADFIVFFINYRMKSLRIFQNSYMKNSKKRYIDFLNISEKFQFILKNLRNFPKSL